MKLIEKYIDHALTKLGWLLENESMKPCVISGKPFDSKYQRQWVLKLSQNKLIGPLHGQCKSGA